MRLMTGLRTWRYAAARAASSRAATKSARDRVSEVFGNSFTLGDILLLKVWGETEVNRHPPRDTADVHSKRD